MNAKKWIKVWTTLILIIIFIIGIFNYIMDPYGSNNQIKQKWSLMKLGNITRPLSYKLSIIKNGNIDTLLLGTSRIGVMDVDIVNRYYKGNVFILSSPSSLVEEQYYIFKYSVQFNKIKTLIYAVDFISFNGIKEYSSSDFEEHKNAIKEYKNINNPIIDYISVDTFKYSLQMLLNIKGTYYSINGQRIYPSKIDEIRNDTFKFTYDTTGFKTNTQYNPYKFSYNQLKYFNKIKELCKDNNIKLIVYIPPMYYKLFLDIYKNYKEDYLLFKTELSNSVDYIDFSGVNKISQDSQNYYDGSHLRKELAEYIFSTINSENKEMLITKKSLNKHLQNINKEYEDNQKFLFE